MGRWLKTYANSLTGKTAMRGETESIEIHPKKGAKFCPANYPCRGMDCGRFGCCKHVCSKRCGGLTPLSVDLSIFSKHSFRVHDCAHVEWAAHLTAWARIELLRFAGGGQDAVYCDTDSLFCERPRTKGIGAGLGEWKLEDRYQTFFAHAPKTYWYVDDDGEEHGASKGIPDAVKNFDRLTRGVRVKRGVDTLKTAARKGDLFARKNLTRKVNADGLHYGDRILQSDGRTYPRRVEQIREELWELSNGS